ncbi:MAG TPA: ribosome maturation factor RimP [Polyangiaceae bacterium]
MRIAHIKVTGLDETRLVALVEPVLLKHGLSCVELLWKTDTAGWVLIVNVEAVDAKLPGAGVTLDVCSEFSRDLAAALDVEDIIPNAYRLEVGSPGLERALYSIDDFRRFAGWAAKIKLSQPLGDQNALRGKILEVNAAGDEVTMETETGNVVVPYDNVAAARLIVDWDNPNMLGGAKAKSPKSRSSERDRRNRASKRKR